MCGRELIGQTMRDGRIRYTDWGNISVELAIGIKGNSGDRINLNSPTIKEGQTVAEQLLNEIIKDLKGIVTIEDYLALPDADCKWLIVKDEFGVCLYDPQRDRFLTH